MYSAIAANKRRTVLLVLMFIVVLSAFGWVISQIQGTTATFVAIALFSVGYSFISYFTADKIALGLSRARPVSKKDAPQLYRIVENLSIAGGLPLPKIYIIDDNSPNAFATGRDPAHASVAVTSGLLNIMEDEELEGVLGHELSHVGNYDIRLMAMVLALVTILVYVSHFFLRMTFWGGRDRDSEGNAGAILAVIGIIFAILAPVIATLLQLAVSRKREYLADASGALLTRYPDGLASALAKIDQYPDGMKNANTATAHLYFASPLKGKEAKGWLAGLFSTHPPIPERIKRLQAMGRHQ